MSRGDSYRTIWKGLWLTGSTQALSLGVNLVRGKLLAVIMGPAGLGAMALVNSALRLLQKAGGAGVDQSLVKETAGAGDSNRARVVAVGLLLTRRLAWGGAAVCAAGAPLWSRLTFGNGEWTWQFVLLAVAVWLGIDGGGRFAVLKGLGDVKGVSRATLAGALAGLCLGVPLLWLLHAGGIAAAACAMGLGVWWFYGNALKRTMDEQFPGRDSQSFRAGMSGNLVRDLLGLGLVLAANDFGYMAMQYGVNLAVRGLMGEEGVGLWQAGCSVANYVGAVALASLAADYFPRLAAHGGDNGVLAAVSSRQVEMTVTVACPCACVLMCSAPVAIRVLLTEAFLPATVLVQLLALALVVRAAMLPLGYISFAKGNRKLFFWMEAVGANAVGFGLLWAGCRCAGLAGMGTAMVADNVLCLGVYCAVNRHLYGIVPRRRAVVAAVMGFALGIMVFSGVSCGGVMGWSLAGATTVSSMVWAWRRLRGRLSESSRED